METEKSTAPAVEGAEPKELTVRAVVLGMVMAMIMGAANAYLGLKAGMTIAAAYTTAVVGMAVIKAFKGTLLEENCARTVGSIGGNIAAGAIFTLPAFAIVGVWDPFYTSEHYLFATLILISGGVLGIMFVTVTRRILVNNVELPFPESIAAAAIHKAGQKGTGGSGLLFSGIGLGMIFKVLTELSVVAPKWQKALSLGRGSVLVRGPELSPAFLGVGYIIGPKLAGINFSGGILAWGLLAPAIAFFLHFGDPSGVSSWADEITRVWKSYVRHIAIGGMLVGAFYTLYKMRQSLFEGIVRSLTTLGGTHGDGASSLPRTDRDIRIQRAGVVMAVIMAIMFGTFLSFAHHPVAAAVAALLLVVLGFVFAAVSGYLVGIVGVSSNPTSGLTVSVLIIVAFIMVSLGVQGTNGMAAVLCVAAFTCVSVSVAGEMMQDLKAGQILGCTPWKMQVGDIFGVTASSLVMFLVLSILHVGDIKQSVGEKLADLEATGATEVVYQGNRADITARTFSLDEVRAMQPAQQNEILGTNAGFGGEKIAAPQASLMAAVAKGIMQKKTEWILIVVGMFMGLSFILMQVKSPMLVSVGMYLPIDTSFAIFLGGLFKGILDRHLEKRRVTPAEQENANNAGTLLASGLIAGEALIGILFAALAFGEVRMARIFESPSYLLGLLAMTGLGALLVLSSNRSAGKPAEH